MKVFVGSMLALLVLVAIPFLAPSPAAAAGLIGNPVVT
jgi:hypothetical protein